MSTHSNEYQLYHYANYKYDAAIIKYVMQIIIAFLIITNNLIIT